MNANSQANERICGRQPETVLHVLGHQYTPLVYNENCFSWLSYDPPGTFVPPHTHSDQDEHIYVLEGEYSLYIDGEWTTAKPGDYVFWPKDSLHSYHNESGKPARALFWVTPGQQLLTLFEELHQLEDPEEVVRVSATRNIFFAGPGEAPGYGK